jgi:translation elongation factor aEF-1 beta
MGKVGMTLRIMPEDATMDMEALKEKVTAVVPGDIQVGRMEIVPVAFGLQALKVALVMEDASPDELEQVLSSIQGVQSVEIEQLGRL